MFLGDGMNHQKAAFLKETFVRHEIFLGSISSISLEGDSGSLAHSEVNTRILIKSMYRIRISSYASQDQEKKIKSKQI